MCVYPLAKTHLPDRHVHGEVGIRAGEVSMIEGNACVDGLRRVHDAQEWVFLQVDKISARNHARKTTRRMTDV